MKTFTSEESPFCGATSEEAKVQKSKNYMKKTIIGNWKSNKTLEETLEWLEIVGPELVKKENLEISIAPQLSLLSLLDREIKNKEYKLVLSAQDVSPFEEGPYTGEVSAKSLAGMVKYVLVGHSERRKNFGEDNTLINLKVKQCLQYGLTPIVCISDLNFSKETSEAIKNIEQNDLEKIVFMYEPPSAISKPVGPVGVGEAAPIDEVLKMIKEIKKFSSQSRIFYGGSIKSNNVEIYLNNSEIDGVIPGSASLDPREFLKIIKNASHI